LSMSNPFFSGFEFGKLIKNQTRHTTKKYFDNE